MIRNITKNNETQSNTVKEVEEVNFEKINNHLKREESIIITNEPEHKSKMSFITYDLTTEQWHFIHN